MYVKTIISKKFNFLLLFNTLEIRIKNILKKIFFKEKKIKYKDKGGWPGLKILPKVDYLIDIGIGHQWTEGLYRFFPEAIKYFIDFLQKSC